jgi:hypothetical protein
MSQRKNVTSISKCRSWSGITIFVATAISCTFGATIWLLSAKLSHLGQVDNISVIDYTGVTAISMMMHEANAQNINYYYRRCHVIGIDQIV